MTANKNHSDRTVINWLLLILSLILIAASFCSSGCLHNQLRYPFGQGRLVRSDTHRYLSSQKKVPVQHFQFLQDPIDAPTPEYTSWTPSGARPVGQYNEKYYTLEIQKLTKGESAYSKVTTPDGARADLLTKEYAIEVDFAEKWAEAIGQSLYYGIALNRKPCIYLIMDTSDHDKRCYSRCLAVCAKHGILLRAFRVVAKKEPKREM